MRDVLQRLQIRCGESGVMIKISINQKEVELEDRITLLQAARDLGIKIPTLCQNDKLSAWGGCRICLVEVATRQAPDRSRLLPSCCTFAEDGFVVTTDNERIAEARKFVIELLLSRCPDSDTLTGLAVELGVPEDRNQLDSVGAYLLNRAPRTEDTVCIRCGLCVRVCAEITERHAISFKGRGMKRKVVSPFEKVADTCIGCGSCAYVCPTNAITVEEA